VEGKTRRISFSTIFSASMITSPPKISLLEAIFNLHEEVFRFSQALVDAPNGNAHRTRSEIGPSEFSPVQSAEQSFPLLFAPAEMEMTSSQPHETITS
jgi:hypothetical protein